MTDASMQTAAANPREPDGLSEADVRARVAQGQTNTVAHRSARSGWDIVRENVFTVFNIILFATLAALVIVTYVPLPDGQGQLRVVSAAVRARVLGDAVFSGGTVLLNMVIGLLQEFRAKRDLDRLAALSVRTARVRRGGRSTEIAAADIVRGDLVELMPGDRIPVDGPLVYGDGLEIDESLLTGESDSIHKVVGDPLLSAAFCVAGRGVMRADQIGMDSYANRLTATAREQKDALTPLQRKINVVIELLVVLMVVMAALELVAAHNTHTPPVDALRFTTVIVSSFVPSGLVLAISVSLAAGAVRIARHGTLVQRVNAVESMGNVTVVCVDKTGTLTQNRLTVQEIVPLGGHDMAHARQMLAWYAAHVAAQNSTARAIAEAVGAPEGTARKLGETPFSSARKWGAVALELDAGRVIVALGSPEALLPLEYSYSDAQAGVLRFTQQGLRVVALALLPAIESTRQAAPVALVVIRDEIRPDIAATMREFAAAGVRVKVISGDNAETVRAIAGRAGLRNDTVVIEAELAAMDASAFDAAVRGSNLFARITPAMKRAIIAALARMGEYVAMVGDGVNDVPALKQARLGIAMNDGAQIAKDVSELVLLRNNMSTLPRAIAEGQSITQKILASAKLYLAKNAGTIFAILFAGFVSLPFPGAPRLFSWIATVTAGLPCLLLALDIVRPKYTRDVVQGVLIYSVVVGAISAVMLIAAYIGASGMGDLDGARTVFGLANMHFAVHVFWDVFDVSLFSLTAMRKHKREFLVGIALLVIGIGAPVVAPAAFGAVVLHPEDWAIIVGLPLIAAWALNRVLYGGFLRGALRTLRG